MIGFLAAGFAVSAVGLERIPLIDVIADLGVTTLLFTIGLKLNPQDFAERRVIGTATGHAVVNTAVFVGFFSLLALLPLQAMTGLDLRALIYIGIAASFSSTVFVMSQLDEQNRDGSPVGRIAIGVLVLQDIIAVFVLVFSSGKVPELWALALPLLLFLRPLVTRIPDRMFRVELLVLTDIGLAVGSYSLFELSGISGSLGSLMAGIILSGHPIAKRIFDALISVRELLLVAFFIQIGLGGLPSGGGFMIAVIMLVLLVFKAVLFIAFLHRFGMSNRTSALSGLTLANYSEFGLIVTSVAVSNSILPAEWMSIMAIAVAGSFILGAVATAKEDKLLYLLLPMIPDPDPEHLAPDERPVKIPHADALILGMGRVGEGVYHRLTEEYGLDVYGIEFDEENIAKLRFSGYNIIAGDVTDFELWERIELESSPRLFVLALPGAHDTEVVLRNIRKYNSEAVVASTTQIRSNCEVLMAGGADVAVYLYDGAGEELADQAMHLVNGATSREDRRPSSFGSMDV